MEIISADPFRCRVWPLHDRLEEHLTVETCAEEIESIRTHGQLVPTLGRVPKDDPDHDVEIVYGARRLFIARYLKRPLIVELREMTDREAIIAMDVENRQRTDISPYEKGLSYSRWLRRGCFSSQGEIARELKLSATRVSRLLKLARLPAVIVSAFGRATDIREEWGLELVDAIEDRARRMTTINAARKIAAMPSRPSAQEVFRQLLVATPKLKVKVRDDVVRAPSGLLLFRMRQQRSGLAVLLPS